jgi:ABC-type oligopeptide transport system substrate-binding subunit
MEICMRKKMIIFLVSVTCAISLSACADNSQVQSDTSQSENTQNESSQANADTDSEVPATETDAVENDQLWKSPLGYSMTYDPSLFTQESVDSTDYVWNLQKALLILHHHLKRGCPTFQSIK